MTHVDNLISASQIAERMGTTREHIVAMHQDGQMPENAFPGRKHMLWWQESVITEWLAMNGNGLIAQSYYVPGSPVWQACVWNVLDSGPLGHAAAATLVKAIQDDPQTVIRLLQGVASTQALSQAS